MDNCKKVKPFRITVETLDEKFINSGAPDFLDTVSSILERSAARG